MLNQINNENFPVIRCIGIGKTYSKPTEAVKNVTLTVYHGEILVLLGPSGCGKTTLLRLIAGFEEPSNGTLSVGGQLVSMPGKFVKPENRKSVPGIVHDVSQSGSTLFIEPLEAVNFCNEWREISALIIREEEKILRYLSVFVLIFSFQYWY